MMIIFKMLIGTGVAALFFLTGWFLAWVFRGGISRFVKRSLYRRKNKPNRRNKTARLEIVFVRPPETFGEKKSAAAEQPVQKSAAANYRQKFLTHGKPGHNITIYMSRELYGKIRSYMRFVAPGISMTSYINNIMEDHLDRNRAGITEIINNRIEKTFE